MEIKVVIIEDEPSAVNRLKKELERITVAKFSIVVKIESVKEAVHWLKKHGEADLIFMDIQLTDGLSLEIFKQVHVTAPVIFTTAYDEYALQAFKVNSLDYLLKPIDPKELESAIQRFIDRGSLERERYLSQIQELAGNFKQKEFRSSFLVSYRWIICTLLFT